MCQQIHREIGEQVQSVRRRRLPNDPLLCELLVPADLAKVNHECILSKTGTEWLSQARGFLPWQPLAGLILESGNGQGARDVQK